MMRGATNRAGQRLAAEYGLGPGTGILAWRSATPVTQTHKMATTVIKTKLWLSLRRFQVKPSDAGTSCKNVELWLDRNAISTVNVFQRVWGLSPDSFLQQFVEFMAPHEESDT